MLAWWVWYCGESARRDELILVGGAMLAGFPLFLIYCEPALGTTLTLTFSLFVLTCTVGLTWRGLVLLVCLCALLLVFTFDVYHVTACFRPVEHSFPRWILHRALKPYQLRRIRGHRVRSDTDIFAGGNNEVQALITLGRGGLVGHGPDEAHQVVEGYLPRQVSHNDFIICTLAEIGGFCVSGGVLLLEWALVLWCLHVGYACGDRFGRGVCIGVGAVFFVHAVIPLAVALRICPVTGLPIYFVSAGGSALLGAMACLGMVQSVASHRGHPASACRDRLREVAELDTIREFSIVIMGVRFRLIYAH